jgi:hypothetical protein
MKNMKKFSKLIIISIVLITLIFIKEEYFSWGKIKVIVQNDTLSEQTIWLTPKEKFTYEIPKGKKKTIKYSTDHFAIVLELNYFNQEGKKESIELSGYVEKSYHGKVIVKMTQKELNGEIEFEIREKIRL